MRILGIDYGTKRIGLAISDESGTIANTLEPVGNEGETAALEALARVIQKESVTDVVFGLPVTLQGGEEYQAQIVKEFAAKLGEGIDCPIIFFDERLTTSQARGMFDTKHRNISLDSQSAQIILQTYLDSLKNTHAQT